MEHPKNYLVRKIINNKENGLKSLGELHAKHVDDLANVILQYSQEAIIEFSQLLNKGETVEVDGVLLALDRKIQNLTKRN
jgi:hypothetical protein